MTYPMDFKRIGMISLFEDLIFNGHMKVKEKAYVASDHFWCLVQCLNYESPHNPACEDLGAPSVC